MVREQDALWIREANTTLGSRGPAVLDDFTSSYGYKFSDPAGYQWGGAQNEANKL